jgi:hypothetical protein
VAPPSGVTPPGTRRGAPAQEPLTIANATTGKQQVRLDGDTPRPRPPAIRPVTLAEAFAAAEARRRRQLVQQLEQAVRDRRRVGDLDGARLAASWAADAREAS